MEYYEPLTPELRQEINETIEKELGKLNTCKPSERHIRKMLDGEQYKSWRRCGKVEREETTAGRGGKGLQQFTCAYADRKNAIPFGNAARKALGKENNRSKEPYKGLERRR